MLVSGHDSHSKYNLDSFNKFSKQIDNLDLSGSTQNPWYLDKSLQLVARLERWRQGGKGKSPLINQLTFAGFNRKFSPNRTKADWVSRDPQAVDAYLQDPLCGEQ